MRNVLGRVIAATALLAASLCVPAHAASLAVSKATLSNGLQVIVVHDPLAPVVTAMMNYRVGSNEQNIAGQAHALEHMMFRGSASLSSNQLMDTIGVTGGNMDADTQAAVTQYYFTMPSQYLDIALHLERSRATGLTLAQDQWNQERGAITQEVTQDNSDATYRLFTKMLQRIVGGTPYAKDGLGTIASFAHQINAPQLHSFYNAWYHPNNAVYVIVGDVDGPATIAKVKQLFGNVPAAKLPARPAVHLQPLKAAIYRDTSDQAYTAILIGYRLPGYRSKDHAAAEILSDVLNSRRGDLFALTAAGKTYGTEFFTQPFADVSVGLTFAAVPITTKPEDAAQWLRDAIDGYRKNGVPADLVEAAKRREIADLEANGNSIEGLANEWSSAVAIEGLSSPDAMREEFSRVSVDDVNRVLRTYLTNANAVTAFAVPKNAGSVASGGSMAKESVSTPPSRHEPLPAFARSVLAHLSVPPQMTAPVDMHLSNGVRLIVQPEHITHYVVVSGEVLNNPQVQEPVGKDGVSAITSELLPYGTTTYGRLAYQGELDKIAASVHAGTSFSLAVPSNDFDRGVQLLADQQLHPAFAPQAFAVVAHQELQGVTDEANSPDHLSEVALANALYPIGDPERRFPTPQTVATITLDDVKSWYAASYRPDLTTIVVIGDVAPDQVKAAFEKYFGAWTATGPKPTIYPSPVATNAPSSVNVPAVGRVQSSVQLVETIDLHRTDADWAPLEVANAALTGGFYSSLLYHDLREVHGYAYTIGSEVHAGKVRSTFELSYGCDPQNIVPAQSQIVALLTQLQQRPLGAERLLRAKALLMAQVPLEGSSYSGLAGLLLSYASRDLPLDQNLIDARDELNVTEASLQAAMAKVIRPTGFVRVVTGPAPK